LSNTPTDVQVASPAVNPVEPVALPVAPPSTNIFVLTAQIETLKALRYTPAGLPALDIELVHGSDVLEAGQSRQINVVVKAIALGSLAERLVKQPVGSTWRFTGFIAAFRSKPQPSKQLVFHIQAFQEEVSPSMISGNLSVASTQVPTE
jgi:primosomal replication protein N